MYDQPLTNDQVIALLEAAPARITAATEGLSPTALLQPPHEGEWSVRDILAHLRACADMWGKYIGIILEQDRPTFKAVNPRTWITRTNYLELPFHPSFHAYAAQRAALLVILRSLKGDQWLRVATVTGAGKPLERSVYSYAQWLANHEKTHLKQIERAVEKVRQESLPPNQA